ncbi:uncharacterized protein DS421_10g294640 [Arachis hypogaea]|nr:uncharacterized protein DS421_10g294640 [Arachis hypogaea]
MNVLSQKMKGGSTSTSKSLGNLIIQTTSAMTLARTQYSSSAVDLDTISYFSDFQEIKESPRKTAVTYGGTLRFCIASPISITMLPSRIGKTKQKTISLV